MDLSTFIKPAETLKAEPKPVAPQPEVKKTILATIIEKEPVKPVQESVGEEVEAKLLKAHLEQLKTHMPSTYKKIVHWIDD